MGIGDGEEALTAVEWTNGSCAAFCKAGGGSTATIGALPACGAACGIRDAAELLDAAGGPAEAGRNSGDVSLFFGVDMMSDCL